MKILQMRENELIILMNRQMLNAVCRNWCCCVVNVLTVVDWADSIAWLNAQWFDNDYQKLEIECDSLWAVIVDELMSKCLYKTDAKIECSMNDAANLANQNMQNMLSFVRVLTKKSFYLPPSMLISVRRL